VKPRGAGASEEVDAIRRYCSLAVPTPVQYRMLMTEAVVHIAAELEHLSDTELIQLRDLISRRVPEKKSNKPVVNNGQTSSTRQDQELNDEDAAVLSAVSDAFSKIDARLDSLLTNAKGLIRDIERHRH
jgi:hypothetical protein